MIQYSVNRRALSLWWKTWIALSVQLAGCFLLTYMYIYVPPQTDMTKRITTLLCIHAQGKMQWLYVRQLIRGGSVHTMEWEWWLKYDVFIVSCRWCTPGFVMGMNAYLDNTEEDKRTIVDIENAFDGHCKSCNIISVQCQMKFLWNCNNLTFLCSLMAIITFNLPQNII